MGACMSGFHSVTERETEIVFYVIQIFVINIEGLTCDSSFICTGLNMG